MRMYAVVEFDREITERHYLSPGGYEMISNGELFHFDFMDYAGSVDKSDRRCVVMEMKGFFNLSESKKSFNPRKITEIKEFFVYTGDSENMEIHPVKIRSLEFEDEKGIYKIPESILKTAVVSD